MCYIPSISGEASSPSRRIVSVLDAESPTSNMYEHIASGSALVQSSRRDLLTLMVQLDCYPRKAPATLISYGWRFQVAPPICVIQTKMGQPPIALRMPHCGGRQRTNRCLSRGYQLAFLSQPPQMVSNPTLLHPAALGLLCSHKYPALRRASVTREEIHLGTYIRLLDVRMPALPNFRHRLR